MLPGDAADSGVPGALMVDAGARINRRVADDVVVHCFSITHRYAVRWYCKLPTYEIYHYYLYPTFTPQNI